MMLPGILRGQTLGDTVARMLIGALILVAVVTMGWGLISGKFWAWRADVWEGRAENAAGEAKVAQDQLKSSEQGAENATLTRQNMDTAIGTGRYNSEQSAGRIDDYANRPDRARDDDGPPDDVVLQELEGAEDAYRAAAHRLQRARPR